jgi:general secretion pathway protein I
MHSRDATRPLCRAAAGCPPRRAAASAATRARPLRRSAEGVDQVPPRGFSLLEVLVAFVILSLVAIALFRLFSGALGNASAADDYSRAVLVAESALAAAAAEQPLREATQSGSADDGRIAWTTRVAPYAPPGVSPDIEQAAESMPIRLYRISAEVTFPAPTGGQRTFALATVRVGARDAK